MSLTRTYFELKNTMVETIQNKLTREGMRFAPDILEKISNDFIVSYQSFRDAIAHSEQAHLKIDGEIVWTIKRNELIQEFSEVLNHIFAPLGGLNPGQASAYWSGLGLKRAEEFGIDFAKTIPGYIINQIHTTLKSTLTSHAYTSDDHIDTSTDMGLWEAMSALYAQGTIKEANIFLIDGITSQYSILWNTELQTLRTLQKTGEVTNIWIHTLKPHILDIYQALLAEKKSSKDPAEIITIDRRITKLLKNTNHWEKEDINESHSLSLKISGLTHPLKTVSYEKLTKITHAWIENNRNIHAIKELNAIFKQLTTTRVMSYRNYDLLVALQDKLSALNPHVLSPKAHALYQELTTKLRKLGITPAGGSPISTSLAEVAQQARYHQKAKGLDLSSSSSIPSLPSKKPEHLSTHNLFTSTKKHSHPKKESPTIHLPKLG